MPKPEQPRTPEEMTGITKSQEETQKEMIKEGAKLEYNYHGSSFLKATDRQTETANQEMMHDKAMEEYQQLNKKHESLPNIEGLAVSMFGLIRGIREDLFDSGIDKEKEKMINAHLSVMTSVISRGVEREMKNKGSKQTNELLDELGKLGEKIWAIDVICSSDDARKQYKRPETQKEFKQILESLNNL